MRPPRARLLYAALVLATVALGLSSRKFSAALPAWAAKNAGDALYATMVFFGLGLFFAARRTREIAAAALLFCWIIEFSQAVHRPWLDAIRSTRAGALVLGQGFHALDLVDYVVGVALGVAVELLLVKARKR